MSSKVRAFKRNEGIGIVGDDYFPEEFMPKPPIEQTMEEDAGISVLQKSASVKLNSPNNRRLNNKLARPNSRSNRANNSQRIEIELGNAAPATF